MGTGTQREGERGRGERRNATWKRERESGDGGREQERGCRPVDEHKVGTIRSTIRGERGCHKFVPVSGWDGTTKPLPCSPIM